MVLYGMAQQVTFKTFHATYPSAGGVIRVVIVKRSARLFAGNPLEWVAQFCTDPKVPAITINEAVADRSAIEQDYHDVREAHGAGQQQVRNVWCNMACWNFCLWLHTIIELWPWRRSAGRFHCQSEPERPPYLRSSKSLGAVGVTSSDRVEPGSANFQFHPNTKATVA